MNFVLIMEFYIILNFVLYRVLCEVIEFCVYIHVVSLNFMVY